MQREKCDLDPNAKASDLDPQTCYQRVMFCRGMLNLHGFLTETENRKIVDRISEWCNRKNRERHEH